MNTEGSKDRPSAFIRGAQYASLGLEMGLAVAIGAGLGWWLDRTFGTKPWLMLVFLLFGVAAGFKAVYSAARRAMTDSRTDDEEKKS